MLKCDKKVYIFIISNFFIFYFGKMRKVKTRKKERKKIFHIKNVLLHNLFNYDISD